MDDKTLVFMTIMDKLREYFPDATVEMEYKLEREHGLPAYWLYVYTELSAEQAGQQMDAFDNEWWLENSRYYNVGVNLRFKKSV